MKKGTYSLPYIKSQTLAGMTLGRIEKGIIGTPEEVAAHIAAYNTLEPVLRESSQADPDSVSYIEKSYLDKVTGREEELVDFLMELYKDTFVVSENTINGLMRFAAIAESMNSTALSAHLSKMISTATSKTSLSRTPNSERSYFLLRCRRDSSLARILREAAQTTREAYTPLNIAPGSYGNDVITASVAALRGTIHSIDSYRDLDLMVRLDFFYFLLSSIGGGLVPSVIYGQDQVLEPLYQQYMKEQWPQWDSSITEIWSEALASKYKKNRDTVKDDIKLSLKFLAYNLLQRNPISIDKYTEVLRRVKPALLTAYYVREKDETDAYVMHIDIVEREEKNFSSIFPKASRVDFWYTKGIEDALRVTVRYMNSNEQGIYESYSQEYVTSQKIMTYDKRPYEGSGNLALDKNIVSAELKFELLRKTEDGYVVITNTSSSEYGHIDMSVNSSKNNLRDIDSVDDFIINKNTVFQFMEQNNFFSDYYRV